MNESLRRSESRLAIEGELTIYTAAEHCGRLQRCLEEGPDCVLDLSAVSEIDAAGIQLLLWASRKALEQSGRLTLSGCSEAVAAAIRFLQLDAVFAPDSGGPGQEIRR